MALLLHEELQPAGELGLWEVAESEDWYADQLPLSPPEQAQLDRIKGRRRVEWLAARYLVHYMSGREIRGTFCKDEYGKPHLEDSAWHISISHSDRLAAVIAAPRLVGVDIQRIVGKIGRIAHRFMSAQELKWASGSPHELELMHIVWGTKESIYKAYGRRELDFRVHMQVTAFDFTEPSGSLHARIDSPQHCSDYQLWYRLLSDFVLVYGWEVAPPLLP